MTREVGTVLRDGRLGPRYLALVGAGTLACAALGNLVLDLSTVPSRLTGHPGQTVVSTLVLWLAVLLLVCVTSRIWLSAALMLGLCLVLATASSVKHGVRGEPLLPADLYFLRQPRFLLGVAPTWALVLVPLAVVVIGVVLMLVGRRFEKPWPTLRRSGRTALWRRLLVLRVVVGVVAIAVLMSAARFNAEGNRLRAAYEAMGARWQDWHQSVNYSENGFLAGFLNNTVAEAMAKPPGYSRAAMAAVAARYDRRAEEYNSGRSADALRDLNVVLLLSEGFSDPGRLDGVELSQDPIPFVRRTMADQPSGQAVANAIGGGTANMEFEALTGMSQALFQPQLTTPFQMLVPAHDWMPSAAWYLGEHGHDTVALHPYVGSLYRRNATYPRLGFDRFLDISRLPGLTRIGRSPFVSDASTFDAAVRVLDTADRPLFLNLVTIQNHYPYAGRYDDPVGNSLGNQELGQYARGILHSDRAMERLLRDLGRLDEESVVLAFGDHVPGGIYSRKLIKANGRKATETPMFLWSSRRDLPARDLGDTSPVYFMPLLLDAVGAPLPPYYALLLDLHAEVPDLSATRPVDPSTLSSRARGLLRDLRLVQYDFSEGDRFAAEAMFHAPPDR